jgi:hypothetical protein
MNTHTFRTRLTKISHDGADFFLHDTAFFFHVKQLKCLADLFAVLHFASETK